MLLHIIMMQIVLNKYQPRVDGAPLLRLLAAHRPPRVVGDYPFNNEIKLFSCRCAVVSIYANFYPPTPTLTFGILREAVSTTS